MLTVGVRPVSDQAVATCDAGRASGIDNTGVMLMRGGTRAFAFLLSFICPFFVCLLCISAVAPPSGARQLPAGIYVACPNGRVATRDSDSLCGGNSGRRKASPDEQAALDAFKNE